MKTIEEAFKEFQDADYLKGGSQQAYFRGGFVAGKEAGATEQKAIMMEEASKGFDISKYEEWAKCDLYSIYGGCYEKKVREYVQKLWQAAVLSKQKEIEQFKKDTKVTHELLIKEIEELTFHINEKNDKINKFYDAIADLRDTTGIFERNESTIACPFECILEAKALIEELKKDLDLALKALQRESDENEELKKDLKYLINQVDTSYIGAYQKVGELIEKHGLTLVDSGREKV